MASSSFSRESYAIGIICALVVEKAAVESMLDEEHDSLPQEPGDTNSYTFGKIGKHNVAIACLPGQQGKATATAVAVHMMHSFPIKLGLMVGIGGGVPSQLHDLRLGDVVVSMPEGVHPGVVQYDLGKLESEGFRRKGHLEKPPKALLGAVTSLRARHERRDPEFPGYLTAITQNSRMAAKYGHQGTDHDRLFDVNDGYLYSHDTCDECISKLRTVKRDLRRDNTPQVFYGTIGSGDIVMKDGHERDLRAAQDKIICFEMEAAGLMNDFPCLIVRGISDYADSHKNDRWQPYAAATAAAYTKELLSVVNVQEVERMGTARKHQVPFSLKGVPAIDHFVSRDSDMQKLEEVFLPRETCQTRRKIFVVHGLGGIGKTQLCVEFARKHRADFTSIFWLDGSSKDGLRQAFVDVATRLPPAELPPNVLQTAEGSEPSTNAIVQAVLTWLSIPSNQRWLLIMDNVDRDHMASEADPLAYDVMEFCPKADHGNILITSRLSTLKTPQDSLSLGQVDATQGRAIFEACCGESLSAANSNDVNALLERLSGLPLALTQAGAFIRQSGISIAEYIESYDITWKELIEEQHELRSLEYAQRSLLTTWTVSYDQVKRQRKEASRLLQLWSFLDHSDLWYELVACAKEIEPEINVPEWLLLFARSKVKYYSAVAILVKYSLANSKSETRSHSMHPVLHAWCRDFTLSTDDRSAFQVIAATVVGKMMPWNEANEHWKLRKRLLPHGQRCLDEIVQAKDHATELISAPTLYCLASLFFSQEKFRAAEQVYDRVLIRTERVFGPEALLTLKTISDMASLYLKIDHLAKSETMFDRALKGFEKTLGSEHHLTLDTIHNLGGLYKNQNKFLEAEKLWERALAGYAKNFGPGHRRTMNTVGKLGILYVEQHKFTEAERAFKRALANTMNQLEALHPSTLEAVSNLGMLYGEQGRLTEAEEMLEQAVAGYEKPDFCGPAILTPLIANSNLGRLYRLQGRFTEAERMLERALSEQLVALGTNHRHAIRTATELGLLFTDQCRFSELEKTRRRVQADASIWSNFFDHALLAAARAGNMKAVHMLLGRDTSIGAIGEPCDRTALLEAAEDGPCDTARAFISSRARLAAQDTSGATPLHYAAENGHLEVVKVLMQAGSDFEMLDKTERTPLSRAEQKHRHEVIEWMEAYVLERTRQQKTEQVLHIE